MNYRQMMPCTAATLVSAMLISSSPAQALNLEIATVDAPASCEAAAEDHIKKMEIVFKAINDTKLARDDRFLTTVGDIASPNLVRYDLTGNMPGIRGQDAPKNFISSLKSGFSDLELVIDHIFANCDYVTIRFKTVGTNDGEFLDFHQPINQFK